MTDRLRALPSLLLAAALALAAAPDAARPSVAEGPAGRPFRNEGILKEDVRKVGREVPGLADPVDDGKIGAAFDHAEIDALSADADNEPLPGPEEDVDSDEGFISAGGTYVDLSRRDTLREEIPDVSNLYFDVAADGRFEDDSDPAPPPMNYTILDEMIETRERMTSRVEPAPDLPEKEEPTIGRFLDAEKPVLRISKKLEKTIKRRVERPGRDRGDEEEDEEVEDARAIVMPRAAARGNAFRWPVVAKRISSRFGWRIHPIRHRRKFHNGLDLAANYGRPIIAAGDGVVEYSGWKSYYGKTIIIRHPNGLKTLYAHCSKLIASRGQKVSAGTKIAQIGSTGLSTGPHLHFGVMKGGQFVNPMSFLK